MRFLHVGSVQFRFGKQSFVKLVQFGLGRTVKHYFGQSLRYNIVAALNGPITTFVFKRSHGVGKLWYLMKVVDGAGDFIASHHNVYILLLKVKSLEINYLLGLIFCQKQPKWSAIFIYNFIFFKINWKFLLFCQVFDQTSKYFKVSVLTQGIWPLL